MQVRLGKDEWPMAGDPRKWGKGSPWNTPQAFSLSQDPNDILRKKKKSFKTERKQKIKSM